MAAADFILKLEISETRNPQAESVADALTAWVEMMRVAASVIEPGAGVRIELVGVEPGSQMFKLAIRRIEELSNRIKDGAEEFPLVSKAAMTVAGLVAGTVLGVGITNALTPDPRIPPDQMAVFNHMNEQLHESVALQRQTMRLYGVLQNEPAFDRVDVLRGSDHGLIYSVPRNEFAPRSGLWSQDAPATSTVATRTAVWDVTLIKPTLIPKARRWTFAREGVEFSAVMDDPLILDAIHNKTLPIQIAEGITMKIEVQYREEFDGKAWMPVASSRKVKRVLHPLPPTSSVGFFSAPGEP